MLQDVRLTRSAPAILSRAALGLAGILVLSGFSWFGHSLVNGYYVSTPDPDAVIMAHLVEAPRGHLSGTIVVTTVTNSDSGPEVKRITVQGRIAGENVTLKTPGFFGHFRTVYIGTLESGRLTLSRAGHSSFTLSLISEAGYQHRLAVLDAAQTKVSTYRKDQRQILAYVAYVKKLKAAVPPYLAWGRARINHEAGVKVWWGRKIAFYNACLAKIQPMAAAGVPEWKWAPCARAVLHDVLQRHQELALIRRDQQIDRVNADAIEKMIEDLPDRTRAVAFTLHAMCPEQPSPTKCRALWKRETTFASSAALMAHYKLLREFEQVRPQVRQALQNDAAVAADANHHLQAVAAKITAILTDPDRYRST
jgi:hypothetical protein